MEASISKLRVQNTTVEAAAKETNESEGPKLRKRVRKLEGLLGAAQKAAEESAVDAAHREDGTDAIETSSTGSCAALQQMVARGENADGVVADLRAEVDAVRAELAEIRASLVPTDGNIDRLQKETMAATASLQDSDAEVSWRETIEEGAVIALLEDRLEAKARE